MTSNFICNGTTYGVKYDTTYVPVSFDALPATVDVEGYTLTRKDEFHVSLVCMGKIKEKCGINDPDFVANVIRDFCMFVQHAPLGTPQYGNEFRFAAEGELHSVVVMCDIAGLNTFFDVLNKKYHLALEYPPTHVTLYTLQKNVGIFITDNDDIHRLTKPIVAPVHVAIV